MSLRVLYVCTGNICRSPIAERLLQVRSAGLRMPVIARSAGVRALVGHEMDEDAAAVLRALGGSPDEHAGRQLDRDLVLWADLILAGASVHRSAVLALEPGALRRTFTMLEFDRLLTALPPITGDEEELVPAVFAQRGLLEPPAAGADDIEDPYRKPFDVMQACGARIETTVDRLVAVLAALEQVR